MAYPVAYQADYQEQQSRLTTFFRLIVAIPWFIVAYFWALVGGVCVIISWFALLFTGRYPEGLYGFVAKYLRFSARANSWMYLMTDVWPPFDGNDHPEYPIRLLIPQPQAEYSRVKVLFRIIVGIPVIVMHYLFTVLLGIIGIVAWVVIVITGKLPKGVFDLLKMSLAYTTLAATYFSLVTETYPPITPEDDGSVAAPAPPSEPSPFGS